MSEKPIGPLETFFGFLLVQYLAWIALKLLWKLAVIAVVAAFVKMVVS